MKQFSSVKKALSFVMMVCIVLSCTLVVSSAESKPKNAFGSGESTAWMDNTQYDIPEHIPQTYSFKWNEFIAKAQEIILFKGDTLIYEPEPLDSAAWSALPEGQVLSMFKGFAVVEGETDRTAEIADINEVSPYSGEFGTVYTSITITSDKPVRLGNGTGAGPISNSTPDAQRRTKAYRGHYIGIFEILEPVMGIAYDALPPNWSIDDARIYDGENDPTEYYWTFEEYNLPAFTGKPVAPGYHFDRWNVFGGQEAYFFTPVTGTTNRFHVNPPVLWAEMLSGWRGTTRFYASYRSDADCGTVKLDANGGKIENLDFRVYEVDLSWTGTEAVITSDFTLKEPQHETKFFAGWYADPDCTQKVDSVADIVYTGNSAATWDRSKTLYAKWNTGYSIEVSEREGNGTASASVTKAAKGTQITLFANPKPGYHFVQWQVVSNNVTINNNKFIMPEGNVSIEAVFEANAPTPPSETKHEINCIPGANGSVTADKQSANSGETVTLTVTPKEGYKLKSLLVLDGLGNDCVQEGIITLSNNQFVMPDMAITVQATFEKNIADGLTDEVASMSGTIQFGNEIPDDCILDIRPGTLPDSFNAKEGETVKLFEIRVFRNNELYPISGNDMTVTIALTDDLLGYDYYRVSYLNAENKLTETQNATVNGKYLQFVTNHLSDYVVEAGNNPNHTHSFADTWQSDNTNHWHECTCGLKSDTASHNYGEWTVTKEATAAEKGSKERVCSVCGHKETAVISATGLIQNTAEASPQTGDASNMILWLVLLVLSGGFLTVLSAQYNKRRKHNKCQ